MYTGKTNLFFYNIKLNPDILLSQISATSATASPTGSNYSYKMNLYRKKYQNRSSPLGGDLLRKYAQRNLIIHRRYLIHIMTTFLHSRKFFYCTFNHALQLFCYNVIGLTKSNKTLSISLFHPLY